MKRKYVVKPLFEVWDFRIDKWDHSYAYGIRKRRKEEDSFEESGHFTLDCTVTYPDAKEGSKARLFFIPSLEMDALMENYDRHDTPHSPIGNFCTRKGSMTAFLQAPWKGHRHIISLMDSGTFKFVQLDGHIAGKNDLAIQSVRFCMNDPEAE